MRANKFNLYYFFSWPCGINKLRHKKGIHTHTHARTHYGETIFISFKIQCAFRLFGKW